MMFEQIVSMLGMFLPPEKAQQIAASAEQAFVAVMSFDARLRRVEEQQAETLAIVHAIGGKLLGEGSTVAVLAADADIVTDVHPMPIGRPQ